jgi:hypothetical protein
MVAFSAAWDCHFIRVREARSDTCPAVASYRRLYRADMGQ